MKQIIRMLSSLIIVGASTSTLAVNSQISKLTSTGNLNSISVNSSQELEGQDPILSDFSKGDGG